MAVKEITNTELAKLYYAQEKTLNEIATTLSLNSEASARYHIKQKQFKPRDREYTLADEHSMAQAMHDLADGDNFNVDMAKVAMVTQCRRSKVVETLKMAWETKFHKTYDVDRKEDKVAKTTATVAKEPVEMTIAASVRAPEVGVAVLSESVRECFEVGLPSDGTVPLFDGTVPLFAAEQIFLRQGEAHVAHSGVAVDIPQGFIGLIVPDNRLANLRDISLVGAPIVLTSSNAEEIKVKLINLSKGAGSTTCTLDAGTQIAQVVVIPLTLPMSVVLV